MTTTSDKPSGTSPQDNVLIIGAGFSIDGEVQGQGTVLVHGSIKGHVKADTVKLSETAHVNGHIDCAQLDIAGRLDGSFAAADVVIRQGGVVITSARSVSRGTLVLAGAISGQLQAQQLKVEASGQLSGQTQAAQADVHGYVQGEITVDDMVVRSRASVEGQLVYGNLSMERGSDISGQLQRKDRREPAPAGKADDTVVIHLPVSVVQQLRKNPADLRLSLVGGESVPSWISVDREHAWLVLGKTQIDQLVARGQTISLRLQAGSEDITFKLPPSAS